MMYLVTWHVPEEIDRRSKIRENFNDAEEWVEFVKTHEQASDVIVWKREG